MKNNLQHIIRNTTIILLMVAIVFPSVVKFAHVFETHKHEVCDSPSSSHFHEVDIDCEFYKFKLNTTFNFVFNDYNLDINQSNFKTFYSTYTFLKRYRNFGIALRGPPSILSSKC